EVTMAKRGAGEGTIYQGSDGRWEAKIDVGWQGGRRRRKSIYGETRREVHEKLVAALKAQGEGRLVAGKVQTVGQFLQEWLEVARPGRRPKTTPPTRVRCAFTSGPRWERCRSTSCHRFTSTA